MEVEKVKESLKIIHRMKKDLTELRRNWMLDLTKQNNFLLYMSIIMVYI